jgi:hypothetical protein
MAIANLAGSRTKRSVLDFRLFFESVGDQNSGEPMPDKEFKIPIADHLSSQQTMRMPSMNTPRRLNCRAPAPDETEAEVNVICKVKPDKVLFRRPS